MKYLIIASALFLSLGLNAQLSKQWQTEAVLSVPESVKYYEAGNCLFVSNVAGKPSDKDGNGFISKLNLKGEVIDLKWVEGLDAPKGMAIKDGILYVSNINELVYIDIEKAKIIKRIPQPKATFLNDVTITNKGEVLVSDSGTSTVFVVKNNELAVWLYNADLGRLNGLYAEDDYVLLGTSTDIIKIDTTTKEYSVFLETGAQVDGLEADGKGGYYYSFWRGEMYYYLPGKEPLQLLKTVDDEVQSADIGFIPETQEVLVPTFFSNTVVSYVMD